MVPLAGYGTVGSGDRRPHGVRAPLLLSKDARSLRGEVGGVSQQTAARSCGGQ